MNDGGGPGDFDPRDGRICGGLFSAGVNRQITLINTIDQQLQRGDKFTVLIGVAATLVMAVYAVIDPADRYISLFFVMLGLAMTWRHDLVWSRNRKRASA